MWDCHIHYADSLGVERLNAVIEKQKLEGAVLLCIPKGDGSDPLDEVFRFQKQAVVPVHVFGSIKRCVYQSELSELSDKLVAEASRLLLAGCRGIKMLEGKPDVRKKYPILDFDHPVWEAYWNKLEQEQIPLLFHVNDPEEFWDAARVTPAAKKYGWFYDDTYINNEKQYGQILAVLEKHPNLKVIFPHFFFLSKQLPRLSKLLDRFPNMKVDITPGIELYYNLSEQSKKAKEFFEIYQDRICYGTDIGARQVIALADTPLSMEESEARMKLITRFLEEDGDYLLEPDGYYVCRPPALMHGLGLSEPVLDKIYRRNIGSFLSLT